jgi:hypothetical protein
MHELLADREVLERPAVIDRLERPLIEGPTIGASIDRFMI